MKEGGNTGDSSQIEQSLNYSKLVPHTPSLEPEDKPVGRIYWYSIVAGYAVLAPWNGVLTCMYYFQTLYEPSYRPQFSLPMVLYFPMVAVQILLIAFGSKFPLRAKMVGGFAMLTFFFYIFLFCCKYISNVDTSFLVAVINTLMIGVFNAVSQSTCMGVCGALGCKGKYTGAAMLGNGICGVSCNLLGFACLAIVGNTVEDLYHQTVLFFMVTALLMIASTYVTYRLVEDPITIEATEDSQTQTSITEIFKLAWPVFKGQGKNVFMIFVFTFVVFPGVIIAKPLRFLSAEWSTPMVLLIFNVFDTIGRYSPSYIALASPKGTKWFCLARVLCSISICLIGYGTFSGFFVNDIWIVINIVVFAFTNGAGSTLAMMYGPEEFPDKDKENAGKMMALFLTFGIFFGSLLAQVVFAQLF